MKWGWREWWSRNLTVGSIYFLLGILALPLAIPPGFAAVYWPAAGLAIATVYHYRYGVRVLPGIFVGHVTVNLTIPGMLSPHGAFLACLIGMGGVCQAMIARWLLIYFLGPRTALTTRRQMACFSLIVGPIACMLGGLWGPSALRLFGPVGAEKWLLNILTWWAGDSLGAVIAAPITLAALDRDRPEWGYGERSRYVRNLGIAILFLTMSFLVTNTSWVSAFATLLLISVILILSVPMSYKTMRAVNGVS